ncbi:MAG TPA: hypothetical protein VHP57_06620 [Acidimicrobiia bacterium]|nr:hypothetical protein [Acidimicrobiia bacterium]
MRGSPSSGPNPSITDFGCDGGWAWAGVDVNVGTDGYEATDLLKASGTAWTVVDRSKYCKPGQIPADVYKPGLHHQLRPACRRARAERCRVRKTGASLPDLHMRGAW